MVVFVHDCLAAPWVGSKSGLLEGHWFYDCKYDGHITQAEHIKHVNNVALKFGTSRRLKNNEMIYIRSHSMI